MINFRPYQEEAIEAPFEYFRNNREGNPVVALPTGTGKSLAIGGFIQRALYRFPNTRIIALTHVKELISQNASKLSEIWPQAPASIYSAGLNIKEAGAPITFAGVQSAVASLKQKPELFGHRDLALVDECHLIGPSQDTMYGEVFKALRERNPYLRVIGYTATQYRLKQGLLTEGDGLFSDICCDYTSLEKFNQLLREGYLSPLVPKETDTTFNISNINLVGGEFNAGQLEAEFDRDDINFRILRELVDEGRDRKSWMIFATGIHHAEHLAEILRGHFGIAAAAVHSRMKPKERDEVITAFKTGKLRCIVNKDILTTGFDHPPLDLIGMARPTMSPGLWVQMLGRGTRPYSCYTTSELLAALFPYVKLNCKVLDFAGNTPRLGPINDPLIPQRKKKKGAPGMAPVRKCEVCKCYSHARATDCEHCGHPFPLAEEKLWDKAGTSALIRGDKEEEPEPVIETHDVGHATYTRHEKKIAGEVVSVTLKATYFCGYKMFVEWLNFNVAGGPLRKKVEFWWMQRFPHLPIPASADDALMFINDIPRPARIKVHINRKYPEVVGYEWV